MPTGTAISTPIPRVCEQAVYGLPELFREQILPVRPDRQPGLLHLDEHPGAGAPDRRGPDRADRHHHRRQERRLGRGPVAQAELPFPRVQREPLGLQRRPAPAHARDRPGADRRSGGRRRAGRSHLHAPPRADGPGHLRHDLRPAQAPGRRARPARSSTAPSTRAARSSGSSATCRRPRTRPSPTSATSPCASCEARS